MIAATPANASTTTNATAGLVDVRVAQATTPAHGKGTVTADYDGDGRDDLAFIAGALPGQGSALHGLTLIVRYSSAPYTDYFGETTADGGAFGTAIASGDFNHDGYTDIAVGDEDAPVTVSGKVQTAAGSIWVIPGSASGLDVSRAVQYTEQTAGVPGTSEANDEFGGSLASGDLNGDGYADLAIGSPRESIGTIVNAGAVTVLFGSQAGLTVTKAVSFDQNTAGVPDTSAAGNQFGFAVAIGKVNGDQYADLAISSPYENAGGWLQAGAVTLLDGSGAGISFTHATEVQGHALTSTAVWPFNVGTSLLISDVNGDGRGEVIAASPGSQVSTPPTDPIVSAGAVFVLHGNTTGISATGAVTIDEDSSGVPGAAESEDGFGDRIAAGDVTGDGHPDLLVGVPYEGIGTADAAGVIYLVPGSSTGFALAKTVTINQGSAGVPGDVAADNLFGYGVGVHNFAGTGVMSMIVGTPNDGRSNTTNTAGSLTMFTGAGGVLKAGIRLLPADFALPDGTTFYNVPQPFGGVAGPGL